MPVDWTWAWMTWMTLELDAKALKDQTFWVQKGFRPLVPSNRSRAPLGLPATKDAIRVTIAGPFRLGACCGYRLGSSGARSSSLRLRLRRIQAVMPLARERVRARRRLAGAPVVILLGSARPSGSLGRLATHPRRRVHALPENPRLSSRRSGLGRIGGTRRWRACFASSCSAGERQRSMNRFLGHARLV